MQYMEEKLTSNFVLYCSIFLLCHPANLFVSSCTKPSSIDQRTNKYWILCRREEPTTQSKPWTFSPANAIHLLRGTKFVDCLWLASGFALARASFGFDFVMKPDYGTSKIHGMVAAFLVFLPVLFFITLLSRDTLSYIVQSAGGSFDLQVVLGKGTYKSLVTHFTLFPDLKDK